MALLRRRECAHRRDHHEGRGGDRAQAVGNGGQRLLLVPDERLVVAMTAGEYDRAHTSAVAALDAVLGR
ncbi:hypothetical protein ACFMQL_13315 [Nonomuraea fastidiosa]|uniref:hypothetical protein n=1 Tax=Nonomuraea TaxID=83681 RepID=UPI003250BA89